MGGTVRAIAAVSSNGVIGVQGKLPWKLPREWTHFRQTTKGGTLILGRSCFTDDLGCQPLSSCSTVVVTSRDVSPFESDTEALGVRAANSLGAAVALARDTWPERPIWICGGRRIYLETLERHTDLGCQELVLTRVGLEVDVSSHAEEVVTRFPLELALAQFDCVTHAVEMLDTMEQNSPDTEEGPHPVQVPLRVEWRKPSAAVPP
eukprot:COSAG05_NODE_5635_length_1125_cov_0.925926_1_plen_206_part_00